MARREFSTKVRKQALARSQKRCEAVGSWYGLAAGERCTNNLSFGVEYDHIILDANSKDNSLENCAAVCPKCHGFKTRRIDTPTAAKTVAQSLMGMKTRAKQPVQSRNNLASGKPKSPKQQLAPRALYEARQ